MTLNLAVWKLHSEQLNLNAQDNVRKIPLRPINSIMLVAIILSSLLWSSYCIANTVELSQNNSDTAITVEIPTYIQQSTSNSRNLNNRSLSVQAEEHFHNTHFSLTEYQNSLQPSNNVYWYKLNLNTTNHGSNENTYVLVLENNIITYFDVFLFINGKLTQSQSLGLADRSLNNNRIYQGLNFAMQIPNNTQATLLIRKSSVSPAIMPMTIYSKQGFDEHLFRQFIFWGGALALLAVIALYNVIIYALAKVQSYIWYLLFYGLSFFYFAGLHGYGRLLWNDAFQSWLGQKMLTLNFLMLWIIINFARDFLVAKENAKWHEKYFKWNHWLLLPGFFISLFVVEYKMIPIFALLQIIGSVYAISMAAVAYKNGFFPAKLFLIAWGVVVISAGIGMMAFTNVIEANFFTLHAFFFGAVIELILLSIALAERLRFSETQAISNAFIDPQTQLPNFSFFKSHYFLQQQSYKKTQEYAVILIELKGYDHLLGLVGPKVANKAFRHHISRLQQYLNHNPWALQFTLPNGQQSRILSLPSDQLFLLAKIDDHYDSIIQPIIHLAERRIRLGRIDNQIQIQIGIASFNPFEQELEEVYQQAQLALINAKNEAVDWSVFKPKDADYFHARSSLLADLRKAIEDELLTIYIQPQFFCDTQKISGGEALIRWKHPSKGMISPAVFIPLAEQSNLIFKITKFVIHHSFDWIATHNQAEKFKLAINLSSLDFEHTELIPYIRWQLQRTGIAPQQVTFEVTESAASLDQALFLRVIKELKTMGFALAIDDFGTGYSSMQYIQQLEANFIKIDMTFVRNIDKSHINQSIVEAIVKMADSTRAKVIAEGVETENELYKLQMLGVHKVQGYLLGKPIPALAFDSFYRETDNTEKSQIF